MYTKGIYTLPSATKLLCYYCLRRQAGQAVAVLSTGLLFTSNFPDFTRWARENDAAQQAGSGEVAVGQLTMIEGTLSYKR